MQEPKSTIEGASSTNSCHCSSISANKSSKSSAICSQKTTQNQTLISESGNRIPCEENINERKSRKTAVRETIEICPMDKNDKPSAISGTQTKKSHNSRVPERENNNKDSVRRTNRKSRRPSSCLLNAQEHARDLSATSGQSDDGDLHHQKSRPKRPLTRKRKQESIINKESAPSVPSYETKDGSNDRVSNQLSVASKRSKSLQENGTGCKSSSFVSSSCVIKSEPQNCKLLAR